MILNSLQIGYFIYNSLSYNIYRQNLQTNYISLYFQIYSYTIIFRHGQREPVKLYQLLLKDKVESSIFTDKLNYIQQIPENLRYKAKFDKEYIGILTEDGYKQGLQLGRILEQNYNISKYQNINYQTTNRQRTYYTSMAVQQTISGGIHIAPKILYSSQVSLSLFKNTKYQKENDELINKLYNENKQFFDELYTFLGEQSKVYNPIQLVDAITSIYYLQKSMWSNLSRNLTNYQIQKSREIQNRYFCTMFESDKRCYDAISPFLNILLNQFYEQTEPQVRLLCAHDVTIMSLKTLLTNLPQNSIQYCEAFVIKRNLKTNEIFIDIVRDQHVTQVENCRIHSRREYRYLIKELEQKYGGQQSQ